MPHGRIATDVAEPESGVTPGRLVYRLVLEDARQEIRVVSMSYAGKRQHGRRTTCLTTAVNETLEVGSAACRGDSTKSIDGGGVELVFRCEPRDECLEKRRSALYDCRSRMMSLHWVSSIHLKHEWCKSFPQLALRRRHDG
jgi:hypothetical protein